MKKSILFMLLVVFGMFLSTSTVQAAFGFNRIFGGKIIQNKATEVEKVEAQGYQCVVPGTSITINSIKGPETYFIPATDKAKSNKVANAGKLIMGFYAGKTTIVCTKVCGPTICTKNVTLDTINLFSTS